MRSAVLPLAAGSVLLAVVLWRTGWAVVRDGGQRLRMGLLWSLPVLAVIVVVLELVGVKWQELSAVHVATVLLASVLVGFSEEALFRGIILTALRGRLRSEASAAA